MSRAILTLLTASVLVGMTTIGAHAASDAATRDVALPTDERDCAPPCGYIWPTIALDPDVDFPYKTSELEEFPSEINIAVRYYWDMEQDGTGAQGDAEDMEITFALTKKPSWMTLQLDTAACSFTLIPITAEYDVCTITITAEVLDHPMTEAAMNEFGKRIMVFATSKESGTFKQSYGVEDMRFKFDDEAPAIQDGFYATTDNVPATTDDQGIPVGLVAPLAAIGLAAAAAARRRQ